MADDTMTNLDWRTVLKASGAASMLALAGCISTGDGDDDDGPSEDEDVYTIGMIDSLTSSLADFGERNQRAKELALDDVFADVQTVNETGTAILMVEQNAIKGLNISDRGYVLDQGTVAFDDDADGLLDNPEVSKLYLGG